MFIFNFVFWLSGILILALAIWIRVNKHEQELLSNEGSGVNPFTGVNILIAVGAAIMLLGFLGCCGSIKESRCMLLLFFIGLLLILLMQVAAGIVGASFKSESDRLLNETLSKNVQLLKETDGKAKSFQEALSKYQKEFKCCGLIHGPSDWGDNFQHYYQSCECPDNSESPCMTYEGKNVYKTSCFTLIKDLVKKHIAIIIGIAFGLTLVEIFGLVFSMILFCQIGKR